MVTGAADPGLGMVMYATNYNITEPPFASKVQIDSYEYATSCVPYQGMMHPVECDPRTNPLNRYYVATSDIPENELFYNLGNFQVATEGMTTTYPCGELWVTYDVQLSKPRINVRGPSNSMASLYSSLACTDAARMNGMLYYPITTDRTIISAETNIIRLTKRGWYMLGVYWSDPTTHSIAAIPTATLGLNVAAIFADLPNHDTIDATLALFVHVVADGAAGDNCITITGLTGMATGTCHIWIAAVPQLVAMEHMRNHQLSCATNALGKLTIKEPPKNSQKDVESDGEYEMVKVRTKK
jgi:hypothetical protein